MAQAKSRGQAHPLRSQEGGRNRPLDERQHADYVKRCRREWREMELKMRADRRARRLQHREKMADLARRKARADAGLPFWTDEERENL
jgi:hypothetical protein